MGGVLLYLIKVNQKSSTGQHGRQYFEENFLCSYGCNLCGGNAEQRFGEAGRAYVAVDARAMGYNRGKLGLALKAGAEQRANGGRSQCYS